VLSSPLYSAGRVVLVSSEGGDSDAPIWYRNLVAQAGVEITVGHAATAMGTRTTSPDDKAVLWPQLGQVHKGYESYMRE